MAAMELVNLHLFPCANCSKHPMIRHVLKWKDGPLQGGTGSPWNQNSQVDMFGVLLGHKYDDCNKKNYWIEANQLPKTSKWYYLTHVSNFQLEKKNRRKTPNTIFNFHLVSSLSLIKRRKTIDIHRSHPTKLLHTALTNAAASAYTCTASSRWPKMITTTYLKVSIRYMIHQKTKQNWIRRYTFQTIIFGVCRNSFNPPKRHGAKRS